MDNILLFALECILWYAFFKFLLTIYDLWKVSKNVEQAKAEMREDLIKKIHYINQEKHGDCYYWFDKETDQFLAQGATECEIKAHLKGRFKNHIFVLNEKSALFGPDLQQVSLDQLPKLFNSNASTKTS